MKHLVYLCTGLLVWNGIASPVHAASESAVKSLVAHAVIGVDQALKEIQDYTEAHVPLMPKVQSIEEWEKIETQIRKDMLDKIVFRGEGQKWRAAKTKVEWLETIEGGPGYRIKKLRYEALPGFWIPALLYEPTAMTGKVPVVLNVNGHDPVGKSAGYKQLRCINQAKRGMLALNIEWIYMGQLRTPDYAHYKLNQMDLCGTSGLAPFYLSMSRAVDILLSLEHADPERVAVTGLSGGGWQTIFFSSLDARVTLCNPVAGYSSFRTRARYVSDLGDSEQTPNDMATVADYTHLTAMMGSRAALLTFNAKDNCCFAPDHAAWPLLEAAQPIFDLYGRSKALDWHINYDPGTHNYELDNRQAFYGMAGRIFYPSDTKYSAVEIPSDAEVKTKEQLNVPLPENNADLHTLALGLIGDLPRNADIPSEKSALKKWQSANRKKLGEIVRAKAFTVSAGLAGADEKEGVKASYWWLKTGKDWTVPAVELSRGAAKETVILVADGGRTNAVGEAAKLLEAGKRVLLIDPFFLGESKISTHDFLYAIQLAAVGDRALGLQASQIAAIARWSQKQYGIGSVTVEALGPRTSMAALAAAGLEEKAIGEVQMQGALNSLKEAITQNWSVDQKPELFCFGLLEAFDLPQLKALVAPRAVIVK